MTDATGQPTLCFIGGGNMARSLIGGLHKRGLGGRGIHVGDEDEVVAAALIEAQTRALIVRENRQYARRQLTWFRKEPRVIWLDGAGERDATFDAARALIETYGVCR